MTTATDLTSLSRFERYRRAFTALGRVMVNPDETDQVLVFTSHINAGSFPERIGRFFEEPTGRQLFAEKRAIDSRLDLARLAALPDNTLGYAYATFLTSRGLTPEVFDGPPDAISDERTSYVIQRLRQTHDLWHVVTGHDTDPRGEIALQAFTYGQVRAPSSLILAAVGTLRGFRGEPVFVKEVLAAYRAGRDAGRFATFLWEDHWTTPLSDVRRLLKVTPAIRESAHLRQTWEKAAA